MDIANRAKIRFASPEDLPRCAEEDSHVSEEVLKRKIEVNEIIVAELDGGIVGYLRLEYLWSRIPYIGLIFVHEEHQRHGIGKAILSFLEKFLRGKRYEALMSSSQVNEPSAQAWHRAVGFQECGILAGINEGEIGEVFFRKSLT